MQKAPLAGILPLVEKPSRYLGSEKNAVVKDIQKVSLHFALAFPDLYEIGMSHFGMQILYHVLNNQPDIAAERVFAPGLDLAAQLKSTETPLCSLETGTPLSGFHIIGFSLLYEMNYTNVLMMLDLAGIPFRAADRDATCPVIIAGGPCTVNPEPVADFFDAMVVGDGETVILEMSRAWMAWKAAGDGEKKNLLRDWSNIEGVYIPCFFAPVYDGADIKAIVSEFDDYRQVRRAIEPDLNAAPFPDAPVVPYGRPVHDRLRLEVARGCTRGCRFCQAGMIYRPVRERTVENLLNLAETSLAATGYDDISLLSLSTGDYGCLTELMQNLFSRYADDSVAVSFPSFRAGSLSPEIMALVEKVRKTGFTIAPEAGSERLRAVINKNISEQEIFDTVSAAFSLGWKLIKLYFMIGLPTETDADRAAIVDLVRRIRQKLKSDGYRPNINVSIGTFIPKPHVPFQWAPQMSMESSKQIIFDLKRQLKMPGVDVKWQKPELSILEGLWARGDRRLARLLEIAWQKGCCFDGWSDRFDYGLWEAALQDAGVDLAWYTTRSRLPAAPLPWDHIDTGVSKVFLAEELEKALTGQSTDDCRFGDCQGCGVCDFDRIRPVFFAENEKSAIFSGKPEKHPVPEQEIRYEIFYAKTGLARFFGHLEMVTLFSRALQRIGVDMLFTRGFHPKPKMSFHNPLPLGMESESESFYVSLKNSESSQALAAALNRELPDGLQVTGCRKISPGARPQEANILHYRVRTAGELGDARLKMFEAASDWMVERISKKGRKKKINLKEVVLRLTKTGPAALRMTLKAAEGGSVRPADVIQSVFNLSENAVKRAEIIKEKFVSDP